MFVALFILGWQCSRWEVPLAGWEIRLWGVRRHGRRNGGATFRRVLCSVLPLLPIRHVLTPNKETTSAVVSDDFLFAR